LHQRAALTARQKGLALNALVTEALTDYLNRQEK
jgi:predicted HicB family RNase H-like nuclease